MEQSEYLTAIHEIGHCIAYNEFDFQFEYVSIIPDEDFSGHVKHKNQIAKRDLNYEDDLNYYDIKNGKSQKKIEALTIASISGYIAENKLSNNEEDLNYSDLRDTLVQLLLLFEDEKILKNYFNLLCSISQLIIDNHWELILYLANILMEKKKITYSEFMKARAEFSKKNIENKLSKMP